MKRTGLLVGCGGGGGNAEHPTPTSRTIRGTFTLHDASAGWHEGHSCQGDGGYLDISPGTQVTLKDASGTIIGTSRLLSGKGLPEGLNGDLDLVAGVWTADSFHCEFPFEVTDIPPSDFYSIEISHRGQINYSAKDLDAAGWLLELTLGD
jgi:hypothetical protein